MRENRLSGSEGGGTKPIVSSYPYHKAWGEARLCERSPRFSRERFMRASETGDSAQELEATVLPPASRAGLLINISTWGFARKARCTPGFMLSPASRAGLCHLDWAQLKRLRFEQ
jgi:hypothetical protein